MMSDAALFDLDNTVIKRSALFHLGAGMVHHRLITRREIARHAGIISLIAGGENVPVRSRTCATGR